ncbi:MAG: VCBS repeat-containing protein [Bradymonadales bacterium]
MVFDLDGDGKPEVIGGGSVINGQTGATIVAGEYHSYHTYSIGNLTGEFDAETQKGAVHLLNHHQVRSWNAKEKKWDNLVQFPSVAAQTAYADFGTPGASAKDFDYTKLDGKPELVLAGGGKMVLYALVETAGVYSVQHLMDVRGFTLGGPVTIGDFNNDGLPEIGIASSGLFGVYDPKCKGYVAGKCADKYVLWERWSQDVSSGATGSSLFDFDGDGQAEAVYADECFTRVYEGNTGKVLFSTKRSSTTSIEGPVVADIDGDGSAEILMGSDIPMTCFHDTNDEERVPDGVDPIHEGIRCIDDEDCPKGVNCKKDVGLCTCSTDADCNTQYKPGTKEFIQQYVCTAPIHPQVGMMHNPTNAETRTMMKPRGTRPDGWKTGDYKVCRASRKTTDIGVGDLMIYKDRLDRWVSSRPLWNQHAYNIINIEDDGKVPSHQQWLNNWLRKVDDKFIEGTTFKRPVYNNYRLNKQGKYGAGTAPDITGRFIPDSICGKTDTGRTVISAKLCNRGTKPVAKNLPATFYYYDDTKPENKGKKICTSYTKTHVNIGDCPIVGCEVSEEELAALKNKEVLVVVNEDEHGLASTVECNKNNNTDRILVENCESDIVIVN